VQADVTDSFASRANAKLEEDNNQFDVAWLANVTEKAHERDEQKNVANRSARPEIHTLPPD